MSETLPADVAVLWSVVTISQPPEWNCLVMPPMSWSDRWRTFKLVLPIMIFVAISGFEMVFLRLWLDDVPKERWTALVWFPLASVGFLVLAAEGAVQVDRRSKRILKLRKRAVWMQPARPGRVLWKHVREWQFEPVAKQPDATKVILVYAWGKKRLRKWPMLLTQADRGALLFELAERKRAGASFEITEFDEPVPNEQAKPAKSVPGLWLMMAGYFLLIHSVGPFMLAIDHEPSPAAMARPHKNLEAFLRRQILPHFASFKDLQKFSLRMGVALASSGVLLMVWGNLRGRTNQLASASSEPKSNADVVLGRK